MKRGVPWFGSNFKFGTVLDEKWTHFQSKPEMTPCPISSPFAQKSKTKFHLLPAFPTWLDMAGHLLSNIIWLRAAFVTERFFSLVSLIFTSGVGVSDLWTSSPSLPMSLTLPSPPSSSLPEADFFFLSFRRFLRRKPKEKNYLNY